VAVADELLYDVDLLLIFLVSIGALILFTELGFHLGRQAGRNTSEKARIQIGAIQAAILGLLALLLGFTFSMAMSRYEVRPGCWSCMKPTPSTPPLSGRNCCRTRPAGRLPTSCAAMFR
jgi:hypothetical protein